jgi:hypothetical protein
MKFTFFLPLFYFTKIVSPEKQEKNHAMVDSVIKLAYPWVHAGLVW